MQSPRGLMEEAAEHHSKMLQCLCDHNERLRFIKYKFKIPWFATFSLFWVPDWSIVNSRLQSEIKEILLQCEESCVKSQNLVLQSITHLTLSTQN